MDTLTKSCSPTIVITTNGEVQTHEEATVYVKESEIFLTMKVLEDKPAVLSLGKLCDENGYSYEWIMTNVEFLFSNLCLTISEDVILLSKSISVRSQNFVSEFRQELQNENNCMSDSRDFQMLNQYAMDIPTLPVNLCLSHLIHFLVEC